ncbi:divalent metal cation transporter [Enemella evansiae]|nr:divalent metal cation transporter [Enemella evansiae]
MHRQQRPIRALLGPAFVAAIAYVDPGNVAANLSAGARFGYLLLWVLVLANLMAVLVQYLSAKVGLITGQSLPALLGVRLGRPARLAYWVQAELVALATDLAEIVGGALALHLLFGIDLLLAGVIITVVSLGLLAIQSRFGFRPFEFVVMCFLAVITLGFMAGLLVTRLDPDAALAGLRPRFQGSESVLLAVSMLGATVMPHAVYAHSGLTGDRFGGADTRPAADTRRLLGVQRLDVLLSLLIAGSVNIGMLLLAAGSLFGSQIDSIEGAHAAIAASLGPWVALAFAVGLLASGIASSSVGALAGSVIMAGLLRLRIPLLVRRAVTAIPALVVLALGADPTRALVISQVVLSLGIPFALIPLVRLTANRDLMGAHRNARWLTALAWLVVVIACALNAALVVGAVAG